MRFSGLWLLLCVLRAGKLSAGVSKKLEGETLRLYWLRDYFEDVKSETITEMLCKNECAEDDVLVKTSGRKKQTGRYGITHFRKDSPPVDMVVVYIINLTVSDSGRYRYLFDTGVKSHSTDFVLEVIKAAEKDKYDMTPVYTAAAGENLTLPCEFYTSGHVKSFCKNDCAEDVLVRTHLDVGETDRYRIEYEEISKSWSFIFVKISTLTSSDSGAYSCSLDRTARKFRIVVQQDSAPLLVWILILALILVVGIATAIMVVVFKRGAKDVQSPRVTLQEVPRCRGPNLEVEFSCENEVLYQSLHLDNMENPYTSLYQTNT